MKLGEINRNLKPAKTNLFLCKPDKKTIRKLTEAYDIEYRTQLGTVNEISFKIPTITEKDRVPIDNPSIELIRHRYNFKLVYGNSVEYFIINESNKSFSNEEYVEYKAYSLGYELMDKSIRDLEFTSKNLTEMTSECLKSTNWKVGYVDSEFDLKFRSHQISSQTVLQVVYDLAQKFNAVIKWDTVKREISFYLPQNVGLNKGFRLRYGKYLESFNLATNTEETVTRLKIFGRDGLTIRRLTPTGTNYLEDFSWYMYPFKTDLNGNVLEESYYMSNSLCLSLNEYQVVLENAQGQFDTLLSELTAKQDEIQIQSQALSVLATELVKILDKIDVSNSEGKSETPEHLLLIAERVLKEAEIDAKILELDNLELEESVIESNIDNLRAQISIENNLSADNILELNKFIIEKEYINDSIVDDEDLLEDGLEAFEKFREPMLDLNIEVVNFLEILECQNDWDKLVLGDTIRVEHDRLGADVKTKIIEINYSFESKSISLVIANEREANHIDDFMKTLYDASNTSTVVDMDKYKWDLSLENNGAINEIINNEWNAIKNAVVGGYDQQISISERGIIVKSLDDPNTWLVIQNGMLAITDDSGNTWKHAITSTGIVGERIYGKIISGVNLAIEDESGIWITRGSRTTIFDRNGDEMMRLGLVTDAPDPECFGMVLDNRKHKVSVTSCVGFQIDKWELGKWEKKMYADLEGNFWVENFTARELTIVDRDGYFKFTGNKGVISDGTNPVMWLGYIPSGSVPVCSPPTDFGTILRGKNNSLIYMTKNRGFAIDVNCQNKFSVDTGGNIYAQDVIAHNLKIVDGELGEKIILDEMTGITINGIDGEQIRLNANEGIAIDVNGQRRIWIGKDGFIYGKKLYIMGDDTDEMIKDVDGSYISDLTVNRLKTLNSNNPQNYVHIEDNYIKLKTRTSPTQADDKFTLQFLGTGQDAYPQMIWGAGAVGTSTNNVGYMYKTQSRFAWEYIQTDGSKVELALMNTHPTSIMMNTPHGIHIKAGTTIKLEVGGSVLEMTPAGVKINGTRIDLN